MKPIDGHALQKNLKGITFGTLSGEEMSMVFKLYDMIDNAPKLDTAEIVRCRDCANYTRSPFGHSFIGWCKLDGKHRRQNFYCADGEKK